eukprot:COSAG05_NODE_507_length_9159_cov_53.489183_4_plen_292_part_00
MCAAAAAASLPPGARSARRPATPRLYSAMGAAVKTVYFVRHAHAAHNAAQEAAEATLISRHPEIDWDSSSGTGTAMPDVSQLPADVKAERKELMFIALNGELMFDPGLTAAGALQVQQLRSAAARLVNDGLQAVMSSSLRRTLQTASAFEGVPIVAMDELREVAGAFDCERRRPRADIAAEFPSVDLSGVSAEDMLWTQFYRDAMKQSPQRGFNALCTIMDRPESIVAIISHGAFMQAGIFNSSHPRVSSSCGPPRHNCEIVGVTLTRSRDASGHDSFHLAPLHFESTSKL